MRSFILKALLFSAFLAIPILLISKLDNFDRQSSKNENIVKLRCKSTYDNVDMLFIGNSYTYSGLDVTLFDSASVKAFNLGIATAGPYFYELIINDYLNSTRQKPKVIFLLVSPMSFSSKADNFVSYPIHRYLDSPYSNEYLILKYLPVKTYVDLLSKSFKKGFENLLKFRTLRQKESQGCDRLMKTKGFIPSITTNNVEVVKKTEYLYNDLRDDHFEKKKGQFLLDLAEALKAQNIKVVFYSLPTNLLPGYFNESYMNDYDTYVGEIQASEFISADLPVNNQYFRNIDHLNSFGAKLVTHDILQQIQKIKLL
jgi:hypothetical protein